MGLGPNEVDSHSTLGKPLQRLVDLIYKVISVAALLQGLECGLAVGEYFGAFVLSLCHPQEGLVDGV